MVAAGSTIGVTGGAVYASSVSDDAESKKIEDLEDEDEEEEPEVGKNNLLSQTCT